MIILRSTFRDPKPKPCGKGCKPEISVIKRLSHLQPVSAAIPFHRSSKVFPFRIDALVASESLFVTCKDNLILSRLINTDTVVGERFRRVD